MKKATKSENPNLITKLVRCFKKKDEVMNNASKKLFENKTPMPWNIYENKNIGECYEKHSRIHWLFKFKFFYPIMILGEKVIGKFMVKEIPVRDYNTNFLVFDKSFDESIEIWYEKFLKVMYYDPEKSDKGNKDKFLKGTNLKMLNTLKEFMYTMTLDDTSFRELFNILAHQFTKNMLEEYKDVKVDHVFYTSKGLHDVTYYKVQEYLAKIKNKSK